jgi:hypothetical protein
LARNNKNGATTGVKTDRGILTTRHGHAVLKVPMMTGTLYVFQDTRLAEFVRTK